MGKTAVLAEKPSVGRDLARVLGCSKGGSGYLEGPGHVVTWALGHLVTLADPEAYGASEKAWRLDELPILPEALELVVIRQTNRQFQIVKEQLRRKDVDEIVIATDAGREGELVARWILEKAAIKKPVKRLWISSVTDKAIRDGFQRLKPGKTYEPLYASAVARAASDWYVGINATRALTCKFNAQLSCGRVQTPTLAMIAAREAEIQAFAPQTYYGLTAHAALVDFFWRDKGGEGRVFDAQKIERLKRALDGKTLTVTEVKRAAKKVYAPQLYDLTELQRDANQKFSFSAKETLSIMQSLYERHKLLTYPRTDSRYLTADIVPTIKERLAACGVGPYSKFAFMAGKKVQAAKHFVDDAKVSDHHAIIPTEQFVDLGALSEKERRVYDLVVRRFLAVLYPPFAYEQVSVEAALGGERFGAKGRVVENLGWKEIYRGADAAEEDAGDEVQQTLPALAAGDVLEVARLVVTRGQTKPPAPFTEGTLLAAMENPARYMCSGDAALKRTLGETGGLGTVATRADIIEKLLHSFLIEKKGQALFATAKGRQLLALAPQELREPELTARWEQKLAQIAKGALDKAAFLAEIKRYAAQLVAGIKASEEKFRHDNMTRKKCPECGKFLLEVNGKRGKMLVCQDRGCKYRKSLSTATNARCPNCHKRMELRGEGDNKLFACACGYREKLKAFQERRARDGKDRTSKSDVQRYLRAQEKQEAPVNTALADALAKLKL